MINHSKNRICKQCKKAFVYKVWNQVFCGEVCCTNFRKEKRKLTKKTKVIEKEKRKCTYCKKSFICSKGSKKAMHKKCSLKYAARSKVIAPENIIERQNEILANTTDEEKQKFVQYNDIFLTLNHYKEPLKPVTNGFGYYGALSSTIDGEAIQCHICGEIFVDLAGHVRAKHDKTAIEYKEEFELALKTALVSEKEREKRKIRYIRWVKGLNAIEYENYRESLNRTSERGRSKMLETKNGQPKLSLETKNKRGTCPDQLLEKIKEVADKIGKTPSKREFFDYFEGSQRYYHLIRSTFGTYTNALKMLDMAPNLSTPLSKPGPKHYTDEELLEYLTIFAQENNKIPTYTDFKRGLLPHYKNYLKRFGSIEEARQLAGVYNFVDKKTMGRYGIKESVNERLYETTPNI